MRKVLGYLGKLDNGFGKGSIPKPVLEQVWDCIQCVKGNSLPLLSISLAVIGLIGVI